MDYCNKFKEINSLNNILSYSTSINMVSLLYFFEDFFYSISFSSELENVNI